MISNFTKNAIVLGLLSAVGPFAIDMYLPSLPSIAGDLGTSTAATQMTLTVFFVAFGICQLVYGPLSDMIGRKPPLLFGLGLFTVGSIGCSLAPDIGWLIAFRAVQGIGASAVMVIPRAVIRDLHTGTEATRLMALVMLVFSISPLLAPLVGSALIVPFGWRAVFVAVTALSLLILLLVVVSLPETRPKENRVRVSASFVLGGFARLLGDPHFLGLTFIGGFGMASFFAFLASSSFVYIDHFGLTPVQYSLAFSFNALGFFAASQFAARLGQRYRMPRVVLSAVSLYAAFAVLQLLIALAGVDSLPVLMALLFLGFACLGLVIPTSMVLALEEHGAIAGIASALGGTLQMVAGGMVIAFVSLVSDGTALPMVATIALCALVALALAAVTLRRREIAVPAE